MNECEETNGGCEALCCNTIGSFYCRCPSGLKLNEDGKTCQGESSNIFISLWKWVLCCSCYININILIWYHTMEFCLSYLQCKCCLKEPLSSSCENTNYFQPWMVHHFWRDWNISLTAITPTMKCVQTFIVSRLCILIALVSPDLPSSVAMRFTFVFFWGKCHNSYWIDVCVIIDKTFCTVLVYFGLLPSTYKSKYKLISICCTLCLMLVSKC